MDADRPRGTWAAPVSCALAAATLVLLADAVTVNTFGFSHTSELLAATREFNNLPVNFKILSADTVRPRSRDKC
jgi:hypothetical protein